MNNDSHAKAVVLALKSTYDTNFIQLACSTGCGEKTECGERSRCKEGLTFSYTFKKPQHKKSTTTGAASNDDSGSDSGSDLELEEDAEPKLAAIEDHNNKQTFDDFCNSIFGVTTQIDSKDFYLAVLQIEKMKSLINFLEDNSLENSEQSSPPNSGEKK